MKKIATLILALASATMALPAAAQFAKPEDAIKYRQSSFSVMQTHFFRLGNMVNGRVPYDPKVAADNAAIVLAMSKLPWPAFAPGTGEGETRAKPGIWTQQVKFNDLAQKSVVQATALEAAAKTGNLDALKVAFRASAGNCQSCHDAFRAR